MYTCMIVLAILQEKHITQINIMRTLCGRYGYYIYITILNKKIRSILLAHNQPKRINAHVYMV
jgi:hypothetical protein